MRNNYHLENHLGLIHDHWVSVLWHEQCVARMGTTGILTRIPEEARQASHNMDGPYAQNSRPKSSRYNGNIRHNTVLNMREKHLQMRTIPIKKVGLNHRKFLWCTMHMYVLPYCRTSGKVLSTIGWVDEQSSFPCLLKRQHNIRTHVFATFLFNNFENLEHDAILQFHQWSQILIHIRMSSFSKYLKL